MNKTDGSKTVGMLQIRLRIQNTTSAGLMREQLLTAGFSNKDPRFRPWEVAISSNAFMGTGPSSLFSVTRFAGA